MPAAYLCTSSVFTVNEIQSDNKTRNNRAENINKSQLLHLLITNTTAIVSRRCTLAMLVLPPFRKPLDNCHRTKQHEAENTGDLSCLFTCGSWGEEEEESRGGGGPRHGCLWQAASGSVALGAWPWRGAHCVVRQCNEALCGYWYDRTKGQGAVRTAIHTFHTICFSHRIHHINGSPFCDSSWLPAYPWRERGRERKRQRRREREKVLGEREKWGVEGEKRWEILRHLGKDERGNRFGEGFFIRGKGWA